MTKVRWHGDQGTKAVGPPDPPMPGLSALWAAPGWWKAVVVAAPAPPSVGRAGLTTASANELALSHEDCWTLLRSHSLGRVAIVVEGRPRIFPVNYAAGDATVVFRAEPGVKLQPGPGSAACFEIDDYNRVTSIAWSVMVVGTSLMPSTNGIEPSGGLMLNRWLRAKSAIGFP